MIDLETRMSAIGRKRDPEWQRLRKQLLALKDRLAKRINSKAFEKYVLHPYLIMGPGLLLDLCKSLTLSSLPAIPQIIKYDFIKITNDVGW